MSNHTVTLTKPFIYEHLSQVIDPELGVDIVKLGLIYDVSISPVETPQGKRNHVHVLMTLTTPGCPLAGVFDSMVRDSLRPIEELDADQDVSVELTFDPPWIPDMMDEEVRAELGI